MAKKKRKKTTKKKVVKKKVVKKRQEKEEGKVFSWHLPFLVVLILFVSFTSFSLLLFSRNYREWVEVFEDSPNVKRLDYQNEYVDLDEKILQYNEVEREYAYVEFDERESLFLLSRSLDESLPDWVEIEKTALETSRGNWRFFVKGKAFNISLPWFQISLSKEDIQSVDVYIEDIFLGNLSFKNIYLNSVVENANQGLSRAVQLVNDGNFAERVFENIELAEDSLIIRSRNIYYF